MTTYNIPARSDSGAAGRVQSGRAVRDGEFIGGASRDAVMVYGHANGSTADETVKAVQEYMSLGYKAVRAQCAIPGVLHA